MSCSVEQPWPRTYSDRFEERAADEWTLAELTHRLSVPPSTLYKWLRRGELRGRQVVQASHRLWLIQADKAELVRLRKRSTAFH